MRKGRTGVQFRYLLLMQLEYSGLLLQLRFFVAQYFSFLTLSSYVQSLFLLNRRYPRCCFDGVLIVVNSVLSWQFLLVG